MTEKDLRHLLTDWTVDFRSEDTQIAATKGLTATPNVIRESLVGQEEESREVSVELKIEMENALPDDARVRSLLGTTSPNCLMPSPKMRKLRRVERITLRPWTIS